MTKATSKAPDFVSIKYISMETKRLAVAKVVREARVERANPCGTGP